MTEPNTPADRFISAGGVRVHYLDWGNAGAQPMVLLHGIQDCARSWDFFAEGLSVNHRVLALDNRGHGESEWAGPGRYGFSDYVSDLECLIDELRLQKIVLIGHSAGARYAFSYAASRPEAIESLVIVDIDPDAVNPTSGGMFASYAKESDEWDSLDDVVERLRGRFDSQRHRDDLQENYDRNEHDADTAALTQTERGHQADADGKGDGGEGGREPVEGKLTVFGGKTG